MNKFIFSGRDTELISMINIYNYTKQGNKVSVCVLGKENSGKKSFIREFVKQNNISDKNLLITSCDKIIDNYFLISVKNLIHNILSNNIFINNKAEIIDILEKHLSQKTELVEKIINLIINEDIENINPTIQYYYEKSITEKNFNDIFSGFDDFIVLILNYFISKEEFIFVFEDIYHASDIIHKIILKLTALKHDSKNGCLIIYSLKNKDRINDTDDPRFNTFETIKKNIKNDTNQKAFKIFIPEFTLSELAIFIKNNFPKNNFPKNFANKIFTPYIKQTFFTIQYFEYLLQKKAIYFENNTFNITKNEHISFTNSIEYLIKKRVDLYLDDIDTSKKKQKISSKDIEFISYLSEIYNHLHILNTHQKLKNYLQNIIECLNRINNKTYSSKATLLKKINQIFINTTSSYTENPNNDDFINDDKTTENQNTNNEIINYNNVEKKINEAELYFNQYKYHLTLNITTSITDFYKNKKITTQKRLKQKFRSLQIKSKALNKLGHYKAALKTSQQLQRVSLKLDDIIYQIDALKHIGNEQYYLAKYDKALVALEKAVELLNSKKTYKSTQKNTEYRKKKAALLNLISLNYISLAIYEEAQRTIDEALQLYNTELRKKDQLGYAELNNNLGTINRFQGQYLKASFHYDNALYIFKNLNKIDSIAKAINNLGLCVYAEGKYEKAIEYYKKALEYDKKIDDKINMANRYNNLGLAYSSKGDFDNALKYYQKALEIDESVDDLPKMAISYNNIGLVQLSKGEINNSFEYFNKALNINHKLKSKTGLAFSYSNLGNAYYAKNDIVNAELYYKKALKIDLKLNDQVALMNDYNNLGNIYFQAPDLEKAYDYFTKALEIAKQKDDKLSLAALYNNLGNIQYSKKDFKKSLNYYELSKYYNDEINDKLALSMNYNNIAAIYEMQNEYEKAIIYYKKAINIDKSLGDKMHHAGHLFNMAICYLNNDKLNEAIYTFEESVNIYKKIPPTPDYTKCLRQLAHCYIIKNKIDDAFRLLYEAIEISKALNLINDIAELKTDMGTIYLNTPKFDKALKTFQYAIKLYKKSNNEIGIIKTYGYIAQLYEKQMNFDDALIYHHKMLEYFIKNNKYLLIGEKYSNMASIMLYKKDYHTAADYFLKTLQAAKKINDIDIITRSLFNIGICYQALDNYDLAIDKYKQAIEHIKPNSKNIILATSHYQIALILFNLKKHKKSIEHYRISAKIFTKLDLKQNIASIYNNIGFVFESQNQYRNAAKYYKMAFDKYLILDMPKEYLENVKSAAEMYIKVNDYDSAMDMLYVNLDYVEDKNDEHDNAFEEIAAQLYAYIAKCYKVFYEYDEAIANFEEAIKIELKYNNLEIAANYYTELANIYLNSNEFSDAKYNLDKAIEIYKKTKNNNELAKLFIKKGKIFVSPNERDKLLSYFEKAKDIFIEIDEWTKMGEIVYELAFTFQYIEKEIEDFYLMDHPEKEHDHIYNYELAIKYYNEAINIFKGVKNQKFIAKCLHQLGIINLDLVEFNKSIKYFKESININEQNNYYSELADNYTELAQLYSNDCNMPLVEEYIEKALKICNKFKYNDKKIQILEKYAEIYQSKKMYKEAIEIFKKAKKIDKKNIITTIDWSIKWLNMQLEKEN